MDGEKIFCIWYNQGEKYWDKCYNVQERYRGSEIEVEKNDGLGAVRLLRKGELLIANSNCKYDYSYYSAQ